MFATSRISAVILVSRVNSANPDISQNFCLAIWIFFRFQIVGLVTYQDKCPKPGTEPGYGHPSQYKLGPTKGHFVDVHNTITTKPSHHQHRYHKTNITDITQQSAECSTLEHQSTVTA